MKISFLKEFKEFAVKGNMIDIAIGVIVGAAFNKVVDVLVKKIIAPPLSLLTGDLNFENQKMILRHGITTNGNIIKEEVAIGYGELITVMINFLIISFTVFVIVRLFNRLRANAEDTGNKKVTTPKNIQLLTDLKEIMQEQNELLKNQKK